MTNYRTNFKSLFDDIIIHVVLDKTVPGLKAIIHARQRQVSY